MLDVKLTDVRLMDVKLTDVAKYRCEAKRNGTKQNIGKIELLQMEYS